MKFTYYQYGSIAMRTRRRSRTQKKLGKLLIFLLIIVISVYGLRAIAKSFYDGTDKITSPATPTHAPKASSGLKSVVEEALAGTKGTYGIVIKNIKTGETYSVNEERPYEAASLYKLWVMTTAYNQIQQGKLKEIDQMTQDVKVLNDKFDIASEAAELAEGQVTFTVSQALEQMITISHNYAALILTEKVRLANVSSFLKENGFNDSTVGTNGGRPMTTPQDLALFFEKLYKRELVNPEYTGKMLNLLKNQKLNNKIPKYLPAETTIAHKTGELGFFTHDAGIVYGTNGDYIIVVLSESTSPKGAVERIAEVSQAVYNYFENPN